MIRRTNGAPFLITALSAFLIVTQVWGAGGFDCDFDGTNTCDVDDIDLLVAEIAAGSNNHLFDLNGDRLTDLDDRDEWLRLAGALGNPSGLPYFLADANLDVVVDGLDFIAWNHNKFTNLAAWSGGDFNADGAVDGLDFIVWNDHRFRSSAQHAAAPPSGAGGGLDCDFNGDGLCDGTDIDGLVAAIAAGSRNHLFDMTGEGLVDLEDRNAWLTLAGEQHTTSGLGYLIGDANLDTIVDGLDFIEWNLNKFTNLAAWTGGDFTADGVVDGLDFIAWNNNRFRSANDPTAIPEPTNLLLTWLGLVTLACVQRRIA